MFGFCLWLILGVDDGDRPNPACVSSSVHIRDVPVVSVNNNSLLLQNTEVTERLTL